MLLMVRSMRKTILIALLGYMAASTSDVLAAYPVESTDSAGVPVRQPHVARYSREWGFARNGSDGT